MSLLRVLRTNVVKFYRLQNSIHSVASIVQVPSENVWKPDMVLYKMAGKMVETFSDWQRTPVVIKQDGTVMFIPPVIMQSYCEVNYGNWPWGEQVSYCLSG